MSIQEQITRLTNAKQSIKTSIENKGVNVSDSALLNEYPSYISQIETGGEQVMLKPSAIYFNNQYFKTIDLTPLDTSKMSSFGQMFQNCVYLESINLSSLNSTGIYNMDSMFSSCQALDGNNITLGNFNTSKVQKIGYMFFNSPTRVNLPELNADEATDIQGFCEMNPELQNFNGLINVGKGYLTSQTANYSIYSFNLSGSPKLTEESLINILNNLYDIATMGVKTQKCTIGSDNVAKLTSEAGQQALQNAVTKGWTVS